MGVHKISQFMELVVLITYIGMLGLAIVFVIEMVFGSSDWASNIRWSMSVSYIVLLVIAFFSLSLMLWLVVTPLKSASSRSDSLKWDFKESVPELGCEKRDGNDICEDKYRDENCRPKRETSLSHEKPWEYRLDSSRSSRDLDLPEVLLDSDKGLHLTTIQEDSSDLTISSPPTSHPEQSAEKESSSVFPYGDTDGESMDGSNLNNEQAETVEKTLGIDRNSCITEDHEREALEPEESPRVVPGTIKSPTSDGPGSFRSLGGKSDDVGSGVGSLSKLAGLGRAARRQLATTLDEFWKQLFDLHGEPTQEAKTRKLDKLLGIESKVNLKASPTTLKVDSHSNESSEYIPSMIDVATSSPISPSFYVSSRQPSMQSSLESILGVQRVSPSLLSSYSQLLDAYPQNPSLNVIDPGEKRYHSLRLPQASGGYDDPPATVHGYQIKSYINRTKQITSDYLRNQMDLLAPKSPSLVSSNYKTLPSTRAPPNGLRPAKPPGFPDPVVSRNSSMQLDQTYHNLRPTGPENIPSTVNEKKYYSMPDISGLSLPHRTSSLTNRDPKWDSPMRYGTLGPNLSYRSGTPGYEDFPFSNLSRDAAAYKRISGPDNWSMWSKQPLEQFGVAEKGSNGGGEGVGAKPSLNAQKLTPTVDFEANLLKSLRLCMVKLLKLEGSEWLFKQNGGLDEDLLDCVAARERFLYEVESKEMSRGDHSNGPGTKVDDAEYNKYLVTSVPNCGEDCVWRVDLIKSFGVWCIHRILELSLMESRPELWGKYTYVLNRLQGIIEPAFSKPRTLMNPCFCLQLPESYQRRSSPPKSNSSLPPPAKHSRGKCTTASSLLDIVKDVEISISYRKGRTGTAAGDVAFPKGKENLASVLKRYKRRFSAVIP